MKTLLRNQRVRRLPAVIALCASLALPLPALAWDGFDADSADLVEIIRPEMFYTRQNAQIYSEMLRLFTSDQTIDFVTLLDAVSAGNVFASTDEAKVYLTSLAETVPSLSNVQAYAKIVREKYLVRQLMNAPRRSWSSAARRATPTCCWKAPSRRSTRSAPAGIPALFPAFPA